MKTNKALCALALGCVVGTAQAATVTFDWAKPNPMDAPTNVASPNCNGAAAGTSDYCGTSLNYLKGGVSVTATGAATSSTGAAASGVRVIQDVVGDYGGLGVLTPNESGNLDQVGGGGFFERLILVFSGQVNVSAFKFYDDHSPNPTFTGHQFTVKVDGVTKILNQQPTLDYGVNLTGTTFELSNPFATPDRSWYLAGMTVDPGGPPSNIPEPGTYALMLAGLAMLGMITRRRTKA